MLLQRSHEASLIWAKNQRMLARRLVTSHLTYMCMYFTQIVEISHVPSFLTTLWENNICVCKENLFYNINVSWISFKFANVNITQFIGKIISTKMFSSNTRTINNTADYEISFFTIAEKIRTLSSKLLLISV